MPLFFSSFSFLLLLLLLLFLHLLPVSLADAGHLPPGPNPLEQALEIRNSFPSQSQDVSGLKLDFSVALAEGQQEDEGKTYHSLREDQSLVPEQPGMLNLEGPIKVTALIGEKSYVEEGYVELITGPPRAAPFSASLFPSSSPVVSPLLYSSPASLSIASSSSQLPLSSSSTSSPSPLPSSPSPSSSLLSSSTSTPVIASPSEPTPALSSPYTSSHPIKYPSALLSPSRSPSPYFIPIRAERGKTKVSLGNEDALSPTFLGRQGNVLPSKTQLPFITEDGWEGSNDTTRRGSTRNRKTSPHPVKRQSQKQNQRVHGVKRLIRKRNHHKYRMSPPLVRRQEVHRLSNLESNSSSDLDLSQNDKDAHQQPEFRETNTKGNCKIIGEIERANSGESPQSSEVIERKQTKAKRQNDSGIIQLVRAVDAPDSHLSGELPDQYNQFGERDNKYHGITNLTRDENGLHPRNGTPGTYDDLDFPFHFDKSENFVDVDRERPGSKIPTKTPPPPPPPPPLPPARVRRKAFYASADIAYEPVRQNISPLTQVNAHSQDLSLQVPSVRHGREKFSFMVRNSYTKVKRNFENSLPKNFSLIFIKNYPKIAANYHSRFPNPHQISHQSMNPRPLPHQSSPEMAALHSWGGKKGSKPLNSHATRQSIHARSGANHARDRLHSKSPTQRHARSRNRSKRKVTAIEVWSLAGDSALLPCDLSTRSPQDSVQMVMWLKEGSHTPLFSVDYREQAGGRPQVWRDNSSSTACRAHLHLAGVNVGMEECTQPAAAYAYPREFSFSTDFSDYPVLRAGYSEDHGVEEPSSESSGGLVLRDVELEDSAIYRCRVDFLLTPTRNARVNLTVVVPPSSVDVAWLLDKERKTDVSNEAGPFREGDSPTLVCYTRSAWPPPRVVWYEEDMMIDDSFTVDPKNEAVVNSITLKGLTRGYHGRRYTCFAANSNLTSPISSTVVITLALDVLGVRMDDIEVLSAGMRAEVKCTVWGSHPRTIITWTLGDTALPEANNWVSEDGNRTVSMVSIIPESSDDGSSLRCAAHNPVLTTEPSSVHHLSSHYDMRLINVNYSPKVNVTLGRSLDATNIKEGDDLYFECSAVAKPPPHKVTWSHNGEELKSKNGILVSKMTLVLQHVSRANAGTYMCLATNSEGTGSSNPLQLDVKYAPVCASSVASQHSVAKHENARISCNVLANPPVVEFSWAFNNTAEAVTVPHDRYVVHDTESVVNYTPVTELDYGTLLCWATNKIGQQDQPCVFQIIAAGKPDPPHNCRAFDVTISSLQVSCLPGDDGGLGQAFVLQVLEASGDFEPVVEVRRESPSFSVANLRPATAYRLLIKASNAKGESRPAELSAYTVALNHPQHETPAEPTRGRETGSEVAVGVLVGAILACLPVAILITVIGVRTCMRVRAGRRRRSQSEDSEKDGHEVEGGVTGRPLINKQGRPGSVGGVSAETGSDITTITGGAGLSSTIAPTPSPPQSHHPSQVPSSETAGVLYQGGRIYSQDPSHELGVQIITGSSKLTQRAYVPMETKCQGENELLEITLPPPAAYDQGYQSGPPQMYQQVASCYSPAVQSSPRMVGTPGYQHVFQDFQGGMQGCHLPAAASGYPTVQLKGLQASSPQIASVNTGQDFRYPKIDFQETAHKVSSSASFATLPLQSKDMNQDTKGHNPEGKMSTVYNPLALFPSSPSYQPKCAANIASSERASYNTGSLKRPIKPSGQDVQRIRENPRNRSSSLSADRSKRESSV